MSDQAVRLRDAVADFFAVDADAVGPSFVLAGANGASSITRAALDAAIRRRVGVRSPAVYTARTFGELQAGIVPGAATPPEPEPAATPDAPAVVVTGSPVSCGVDMELVANLPGAADCWTDPF